MFKFNRLVCVLLVGSVVAVAYGKALKVTELVPAGAENTTADGMAILNFNQGQSRTEVQVAITDFLADTEYMINVGTIYGTVSATVMTNASGNAHAHRIAASDITDGGSACADVTVFFDENGDNWYSEEIDELRATGTSCP